MKTLLALTILTLSTCQLAPAQNSLPERKAARVYATPTWTTVTLTSKAYQWVRGWITVDSIGVDSVFVALDDDTVAGKYATILSGETLTVNSNALSRIRYKAAVDSAIIRYYFY